MFRRLIYTVLQKQMWIQKPSSGTWYIHLTHGKL